MAGGAPSGARLPLRDPGCPPPPSLARPRHAALAWEPPPPRPTALGFQLSPARSVAPGPPPPLCEPQFPGGAAAYSQSAVRTEWDKSACCLARGKRLTVGARTRQRGVTVRCLFRLYRLVLFSRPPDTVLQIFPFYKLRKLRPGGVKRPSQSHSACKGRGQDPIAGCPSGCGVCGQRHEAMLLVAPLSPPDSLLASPGTTHPAESANASRSRGTRPISCCPPPVLSGPCAVGGFAE